jgi:hypothetical protein
MTEAGVVAIIDDPRGLLAEGRAIPGEQDRA